MEYFDSLTEFNFDIKYMLILFNFVTIIFLVIYRKMNPTKITQKHPILLVTAHPDDESMFFQPSIKNLRSNHHIHLLCLSGTETRKKELLKAVSRLGIQKVECIDNQKLKDGLKQKWDEEVIRELVIKYVKENGIKAVITFDSAGVSSHPNHISINMALRELIAKQKSEKCIKFYELSSVNLFRKYWSVIDFPISLLAPFMFVNLNIINSYRTMSMHQSQFSWYRKLFIVFSRYSIINTYGMHKWIQI